MLVVVMIFGMMCVPRAEGCSNDDRIFICSHGVAHVGRNEQEARFAEAAERCGLHRTYYSGVERGGT